MTIEDIQKCGLNDLKTAGAVFNAFLLGDKAEVQKILTDADVRDTDTIKCILAFFPQ